MQQLKQECYHKRPQKDFVNAFCGLALCILLCWAIGPDGQLLSTDLFYTSVKTWNKCK